VKKRPTEPVPCEVQVLKGRLTSVDQGFGVATFRQLERSELEAGREIYEAVEDELSTLVSLRIQLEVEGTIERW
jgi:hypothetical protein